jgi:hypothetical protein
MLSHSLATVGGFTEWLEQLQQLLAGNSGRWHVAVWIDIVWGCVLYCSL